MVPDLPTNELEPVRVSLERAEANFGDIMKHMSAFFYLLVALVQAVCAVADAINNLADRIPDA